MYKPFSVTVAKLVFRHNISAGYFPSNTVNITEYDPSAGIYSILDNLAQFRSPHDSKFHFLMCYPGRLPFLYPGLEKYT